MKKNPLMLPTYSELGKKSAYDPHYNPEILFPIPRKGKREEIGISTILPFFGFDLWNHYEVSWLNMRGKPIVALAEIKYDCHSPNIIESKSMKLYFNSFNNTQFKDTKAVETMIKNDLENRLFSPVAVKLSTLAIDHEERLYSRMPGLCIDNLEVDCLAYTVEPSLLMTTDERIEETLYSNLLKSNCLVTNQPDWGTVQIAYKGKKIIHEALLRYIVSFRNHNEFHEQCIERIFMDIMRYCLPDELTVYGRYTRRGGLDINPYRSTKNDFESKNFRLIRQ